MVHYRNVRAISRTYGQGMSGSVIVYKSLNGFKKIDSKVFVP